MNALREAWIRDLEANNGKQGRGQLTTIEGDTELDCCLGRVCKIVQATYPDKVTRFTFNNSIFYSMIGAFERDDILPEEIAKIVGLRTDDGSFWVDSMAYDVIRQIAANKDISYTLPIINDAYSLINLNDTLHFTFPEIAQVIRANPPGLFVEPT
jgi:hypothetical protein